MSVTCSLSLSLLEIFLLLDSVWMASHSMVLCQYVKIRKAIMIMYKSFQNYMKTPKIKQEWAYTCCVTLGKKYWVPIYVWAYKGKEVCRNFFRINLTSSSSFSSVWFGLSHSMALSHSEKNQEAYHDYVQNLPKILENSKCKTRFEHIRFVSH